jgi:hypothetical protein
VPSSAQACAEVVNDELAILISPKPAGCSRSAREIGETDGDFLKVVIRFRLIFFASLGGVSSYSPPRGSGCRSHNDGGRWPGKPAISSKRQRRASGRGTLFFRSSVSFDSLIRQMIFHWRV